MMEHELNIMAVGGQDENFQARIFFNDPEPDGPIFMITNAHQLYVGVLVTHEGNIWSVEWGDKQPPVINEEPLAYVVSLMLTEYIQHEIIPVAENHIPEGSTIH